MGTQTDTALSLRTTVLADREDVYRAWTEPGLLEKWCAPKGTEVTESEVELMVGSGYRIRMRDPDGGVHTARGEYQEIERPFRLVFTWDWEEEADRVGETLVRVELEPAGDGATELLLSHEMFPSEEQMEEHEDGWADSLDRLERLCG